MRRAGWAVWVEGCVCGGLRGGAVWVSCCKWEMEGEGLMALDGWDGIDKHRRGKQGHKIGSGRRYQRLTPRYLGTATIHAVACGVCAADVDERR